MSMRFSTNFVAVHWQLDRSKESMAAVREASDVCRRKTVARASSTLGERTASSTEAIFIYLALRLTTSPSAAPKSSMHDVRPSLTPRESKSAHTNARKTPALCRRRVPASRELFCDCLRNTRLKQSQDRAKSRSRRWWRRPLLTTPRSRQNLL